MPTTEEQDKLKERTWISEFAGYACSDMPGRIPLANSGNSRCRYRFDLRVIPRISVLSANATATSRLTGGIPSGARSAFASWSFLLRWCLLPVGVSIDCFTGLWFPNRS